MNWRVTAYVLAVCACLLPPSSRATSVVHVSLATMINRAESIAIVRVSDVVPIDVPNPWSAPAWPNRLVTVRVEEQLRGKLPPTVQLHARVDRYINPSTKAGERALLFVGQSIPFDRSQTGPETRVFAFAGSQGFHVLADLGRLKAQQDRDDALASILKSIENFDADLVVKNHKWSSVLNDAAAAPFFDLVQSPSAELRLWAVWKGVEDVQITPYIGVELIGLLSHHDTALARAAARHLMHKRYLPASESLRALAGQDDQLTDQVLRYLQGREIQRALDNLDPDARSDAISGLPDNAATYLMSIPINFHVSEAGELSHNQRAYAELTDSVERTLAMLDWSTMEVRPFRFNVYVWRDDAGPQFRIRERWR